jgi:membrane-bound metal-dependent hydrolase YbcI (DUF457 family)
MPSPVGHALAGAAAGWALPGPPRRQGRNAYHEVWRQGLVFAILGVLPDLDLLLPIEHRTVSHSLTAAFVVGLTAATLTTRGRIGLAAGAAYATHVLLDWLGSDTTPPIGVMALWPFSHAYYESRLHLFHAVSRRFPTREFWVQNTRALMRELLVLAPPAGLACWRRLSQAARQAAGPRDGR